MDISKAASLVRGRGWLSFTPRVFQDAVLSRCALQSYKAGATVYSLGDPPGGLYGLLSGNLGVTVAPGERGPYLAHFAQPGSWIGEGAIITGRPRQVGLIATRDCKLLHLPLNDLRTILAEDPAAWRWIAVLTTVHLEVAIGAADDLMIRDHVKRFIAVLLRLAGLRYDDAPGPGLSSVHVNQDEIAYMANLARTTAGAILRDLETQGNIDLSYRKITIINAAALREKLGDD